MYKIAFDVMGSDNGLAPALDATLKFIKQKLDLHIILFGDAAQIEAYLTQKKYNHDQITIHGTTEVIDMHDGLLDIRRKKDASMVKALEFVRDGFADGMLTGGNSAAFIGGAHFILKEFEGIKRPGFMPAIPTIVKNNVTLLLDAGANNENTPEDLQNFAVLSSAYLRAIVGIEKPQVGLLNIGTEASKGKDLQKEAYELLKNDNRLNFSGNIEPREITSGVVDVVVTDGFTGNIALKSIEGMGKNVLSEIKTAITRTFFRKLAALRLKGAFREVNAKFNYKNHAGAILIGVNGIAFKSHGSSDEQCFSATLRMTYDAVKNDVITKMKEVIK